MVFRKRRAIRPRISLSGYYRLSPCQTAFAVDALRIFQRGTQQLSGCYFASYRRQRGYISRQEGDSERSKHDQKFGDPLNSWSMPFSDNGVCGRRERTHPPFFKEGRLRYITAAAGLEHRLLFWILDK